MFEGRDDADVYVNIEGTYISVVSARYDPKPENRVVLGLDRLNLLILLEKHALRYENSEEILQILEKIKRRNDEKDPQADPGSP